MKPLSKNKANKLFNHYSKVKYSTNWVATTHVMLKTSELACPIDSIKWGREPEVVVDNYFVKILEWCGRNHHYQKTDIIIDRNKTLQRLFICNEEKDFVLVDETSIKLLEITELWGDLNKVALCNCEALSGITALVGAIHIYDCCDEIRIEKIAETLYSE